jgi:L-seryl-tRNA(Ser) seleniumtransferase
MALSPREIPSIEVLRQRDEVAVLEKRYGRDLLVEALRASAARWRAALAPPGADGDRRGGVTTTEELARAVVADAAELVHVMLTPSLRPVINATGVIVHTNLGRAPLAEPAIQHLARVAGGYSNLEYDLATGARGRRDVHAESLLRTLTGAEAAIVVNNNAAATLLLLAALAAGREVIISRAELVEIGGGFRIPDVLRQSGALLREVGTTNRTRLSDYAAAISDRTGLVLRVHPSNFRVEGFTERPDATALVGLGRRFAIPVVEDLGSGSVLGPALGLRGPALEAASGEAREEPTVQDTLRAGFDVVCVSGDKLLGGPQAGLLLGRRDLVDAMRRHPLMRALRVDKLTYAALEATLIEHLAGRAESTVPVASMIAASPEEIEARCRRIGARLDGLVGARWFVTAGSSTIGGGSAPGSTLATRLLAVESSLAGADAIESRLRALATPVIARIENGCVVLDLRTVAPDQDESLAGLLRSALAPGS